MVFDDFWECITTGSPSFIVLVVHSLMAREYGVVLAYFFLYY